MEGFQRNNQLSIYFPIYSYFCKTEMWTRGFIFSCRQAAAGEKSLGSFPLDPDPKQTRGPSSAALSECSHTAAMTHYHLRTTKHGETPAVFLLHCLLSSDGDITCEASWSRWKISWASVLKDLFSLLQQLCHILHSHLGYPGVTHGPLGGCFWASMWPTSCQIGWHPLCRWCNLVG